jgi:hypothetical protein
MHPTEEEEREDVYFSAYSAQIWWKQRAVCVHVQTLYLDMQTLYLETQTIRITKGQVGNPVLSFGSSNFPMVGAWLSVAGTVAA